MKKRIYGIFACVGMLAIILDGRTAISSVKDGITLCLQTVIPALFPFFVLSGVLNSCFLGQKIGFLAPVRRLCRMPYGAESILLIGFISGYPVGAQLVSDGYTDGSITQNTAQRMLGFCSNAGPAFLFGMLAPAFTNPVVPWILWAIHIGSAIAVGWLLPGGSNEKCVLSSNKAVSIPQSLNRAIRNSAVVCGWVILFRLVLGFLNKWILYRLPITIQVLISGCVELSNGCTMLHIIPAEGVRFILAGAMLSFGGMCVAMQTRSVTQCLGTGYYFLGKLLQMLFSVTVCCFLQNYLFKNSGNLPIPYTCFVALVLLTLLLLYLIRRKSCSIWKKNVV